MANTSLSAAIKATVSELKMVKQDLIISYQTTLYEIGELLVYYTPIDTGLASSNWNVSSGQRTEAEREPSDEGQKGALSLEAISYQVKDLYKEPLALFYNPVDYIDELDSGDLDNGGSRQAPAGMTIPTVRHVENIWMDNLQKVGII